MPDAILGVRDHVQAGDPALNTGLLFDFGGTLDAEGLPWKARCLRLLREEGVTVASEHFDAAFYAADDRLVGRLPPTAGLRDTVRALVDGLAEGLGLRDAGLAERVASRFTDEAGDHLRANARLLGALSLRHDLGIVSNFYGNLRAVCDEAGLSPLLKVIVDSTRVGWTKPDARIFRYALDALALAPADVTFVGDSLARDMAGARLVGMPHIWLGDPHGTARPCCAGDQVITSLGELEALLA
jgi:putative hydrolase of the HAD superfamily